MLFDTTFFIDLGRERTDGPAAVFYRAMRHQPRSVSIVTLGEIAVGASPSETLRLVRGFRRIALGAETAIFAGRLQASLSFTLGENDLWIAATALRFGMGLVSNDSVFPKVPGLRVLTY